MNAGATTVRSILDKPLIQLTPNDISQVTREDCRKYLKEKGMRRPSWNKSQAIQQVMCLKALFEPCHDSAASSLRKVVVPPRVTANPGDSAKELSDDAQDPVSLDESVPCGKMEPPKSIPPADSDIKITRTKSVFIAHGILHLAASPTHVPQDHPFEGTTMFLHFPCHLQTSMKIIKYPQQHQEKGTSTRDSDVEGQVNRKISLQRYREKLKDRGRLKSKKITGLASGLESYLNLHVRTNILKGNSSPSRTSSPTQPGLPQAFAGRTVNQPKFSCLQLDLNLEDVEEGQF